MRTRQEGVTAFITLTGNIQKYAPPSGICCYFHYGKAKKMKSHGWTSVPSPSPPPPPFFFFTNERVSVRVSASFAFLCEFLELFFRSFYDVDI